MESTRVNLTDIPTGHQSDGSESEVVDSDGTSQDSQASAGPDTSQTLPTPGPTYRRGQNVSNKFKSAYASDMEPIEEEGNSQDSVVNPQARPGLEKI